MTWTIMKSDIKEKRVEHVFKYFYMHNTIHKFNAIMYLRVH